MSSLSKTSFQEMKFLDEMIDQVIILDKSRNVCCANKSAFTRFGNDIDGKNISLILRDANLLESIDIAINTKKTQIVDIEIKLPIFEFYQSKYHSWTLKTLQRRSICNDFFKRFNRDL